MKKTREAARETAKAVLEQAEAIGQHSEAIGLIVKRVNFHTYVLTLGFFGRLHWLFFGLPKAKPGKQPSQADSQS